MLTPAGSIVTNRCCRFPSGLTNLLPSDQQRKRHLNVNKYWDECLTNLSRKNTFCWQLVSSAYGNFFARDGLSYVFFHQIGSSTSIYTSVSLETINIFKNIIQNLKRFTSSSSENQLTRIRAFASEVRCCWIDYGVNFKLGDVSHVQWNLCIYGKINLRKSSSPNDRVVSTPRMIVTALSIKKSYLLLSIERLQFTYRDEIFTEIFLQQKWTKFTGRKS